MLVRLKLKIIDSHVLLSESFKRASVIVHVTLVNAKAKLHDCQRQVAFWRRQPEASEPRLDSPQPCKSPHRVY